MNKSKLVAFALPLSLCLSLSFTLAACGGSDDDNGDGTPKGGTSSGGNSSTGGKTTSTSGSGGGGNTSTAGTTSNNQGGSDADPDPGPGTDLPGDKPIGDLTDDEFEGLCKDIAKQVDDLHIEDTTCRIGGIVAALLSAPKNDADAQAACKASYDSCVAEPDDSTESCDKPGATCTATIDEFNACLADLKDILGDIKDSVPSCDTLKLTDLTSLAILGAATMNPASCETYEQKCPDGPKAGIETSAAP